MAEVAAMRQDERLDQIGIALGEELQFEIVVRQPPVGRAPAGSWLPVCATRAL
jgi:hypothetical protein